MQLKPFWLTNYMVLKHYSVNFPQTYTSEKKKKQRSELQKDSKKDASPNLKCNTKLKYFI